MTKPLALLCCALAVAGCRRPPPPPDTGRPITIVTDGRTDLELPLRSIFGAPLAPGATTAPGAEFNLRFETPDNFDAVKTAPLLLIIGTTDEDPIQQVVGALADSFGLFEIRDRWAPGQLALVLAAQTEGGLISGLERYRSRLLYAVRGALTDALRAQTYEHGINTKLTAQVERNYRFRLDLPAGFTLARSDSGRTVNGGYVSFVSREPDRTISIFFRPSTPADRAVDARRLMDLRDSLAGLFDNGVLVARSLTAAETTTFAGRRAVFLSGILEDVHGQPVGPFICYGVSGPDRFYLVDGALASVDKTKFDYLHQLAIILETFTP